MLGAASSAMLTDLAILSAALLTLAAVLAAVLVDWRRRIRIWESDPERLIESPPRRDAFYAAVACIGAAIGVASVLRLGSAWSPLSGAFVTYAVLAAAHRSAQRWIAAVGLSLGCATWVAIATGWLPAGVVGVSLGLAAAGAHMLYLARFWEQQLDDGRAWTTTGRMIPIARVLSDVALIAQIPALGGWILRSPQAAPVWAVVLTALLLAAHLRMRFARRTSLPIPATGAR